MIRLGGARPKYYAFLCKSWEDKFSVINIFALFFYFSLRILTVVRGPNTLTDIYHKRLYVFKLL